MSDQIYILDEIVLQPADVAWIRDAYMDRYAAAARSRGMTLEAGWRSPVIKLPDRPTTLHFLWSVPDVAGWWRMRVDEEILNPKTNVVDDRLSWWRLVDSVAVSRRRTYMTGEVSGGDHLQRGAAESASDSVKAFCTAMKQ